MASSPPVVTQGPSLYDDDLHEWASRQASLIRANRIDELDLAHIADELDDLAGELYRRLEDLFTVLFANMLTWDHQPERRSRSGEATIREQRKRVLKLLESNPSLRSKLVEAMTEGYEYGRHRASGECNMPLESFPEMPQYTWHDAIEREFRIDESDLSNSGKTR